LGSVAKVVSGGQTGVDRAALDAAIALGLPYGGWCPRGGWAEDFGEPPGLPAHYPGLTETPSAEPAERTEWNVRDSDATLVLVAASGGRSAGTELAREIAESLGRPHLVADVAEELEVRRFLASLPGGVVLGIGGPRESEAPGIYREARALLERVLRCE